MVPGQGSWYVRAQVKVVEKKHGKSFGPNQSLTQRIHTVPPSCSLLAYRCFIVRPEETPCNPVTVREHRTVEDSAPNFERDMKVKGGKWQCHVGTARQIHSSLSLPAQELVMTTCRHDHLCLFDSLARDKMSIFYLCG